MAESTSTALRPQLKPYLKLLQPPLEANPISHP
jgi:hypothetical protein